MKQFFSIFLLTIPIMASYIPLGIVFGLLAVKAGLSWPFILAMSLFMFTGAGQLLTASMIGLGSSPAQIIPLLIFVNMRHVFYGISFKERLFEFKGFKKLYFIFALTDESWALLSSPKAANFSPHDLFIATMFNQFYWVLGSLLGVSISHFAFIQTAQLDFIFTAFFIILAIESLLHHSTWRPLLYCAIIWPLSLLWDGTSSLSLSIIMAFFLVLLTNYKSLMRLKNG